MNPSPSTHRPPVRPRVLIVEDEQRLRELLLRVLPDWGFDAAAAASAEEGMRQAAVDPPDIIVLDLNLPGEGGLQFLRKARARWPNVQAIVQTGFGSMESAREAIHLEVADFLSKPASLGELERAFDRALRKLSASTAHVLPEPDIREDAAEPATSTSADSVQTLEEVERRHILEMLARCQGNRTAAAAALGISRRTLYYKLDEYQNRKAR